MIQAYDAVVVGGGAIGAACARELARAGRTVLLLDRGGTIGQAWQAAAGMLAPQIESTGDDALFHFGLDARAHYTPLASALRETTGIDVDLRLAGITHIAPSEAEAAELRDKARWQRESGQPAEWLDAGEVQTRWPWLARSFGALLAPRDGALHPERLVRALRDDAVRLGAVVQRDTALRLEWTGDRIAGVIGAAARYLSGDVVLAAGAWSATIGDLPRPLPLAPVRGQMAALPWPAGVPPDVIYSHAGYVVPRDGEAVIGSTMEHAGFDASTTPAGIAAIRRAARALSPALSGEPLRSWAGLRPVTLDGLPLIGADPERRGLWYATGHGRNGILHAALTGAVIAALLDGTPAPSSVAAFSPARPLGSAA